MGMTDAIIKKGFGMCYILDYYFIAVHKKTISPKKRRKTSFLLLSFCKQKKIGIMSYFFDIFPYFIDYFLYCSEKSL